MPRVRSTRGRKRPRQMLMLLKACRGFVVEMLEGCSWPFFPGSILLLGLVWRRRRTANRTLVSTRRTLETVTGRSSNETLLPSPWSPPLWEAYRGRLANGSFFIGEGKPQSAVVAAAAAAGNRIVGSFLYTPGRGPIFGGAPAPFSYSSLFCCLFSASVIHSDHSKRCMS
jgi:hypothetical protein